MPAYKRKLLSTLLALSFVAFYLFSGMKPAYAATQHVQQKKAVVAHTATWQRNASNSVNCAPDNNFQTPFPYSASVVTQPTDPATGNDACFNSTFSWGYTESPSTGFADWTFTGTIPTPPFSCDIQVWIPSGYATATSAQYYIYDGSQYLANVVVDQSQNFNQWVSLNTTNLAWNNTPDVTLSDHETSGVVGDYMAASAVSFNCAPSHRQPAVTGAPAAPTGSGVVTATGSGQ